MPRDGDVNACRQRFGLSGSYRDGWKPCVVVLLPHGPVRWFPGPQCPFAESIIMRPERESAGEDLEVRGARP